MKQKYNIGDKVFLVEQNKLVEKTITLAVVFKNEVKYSVRVYEESDSIYSHHFYSEKDVFTTKEDYIKSL